jgi:L-asparaginase II
VVSSADIKKLGTQNLKDLSSFNMFWTASGQEVSTTMEILEVHNIQHSLTAGNISGAQAVLLENSLSGKHSALVCPNRVDCTDCKIYVGSNVEEKKGGDGFFFFICWICLCFCC